LPGSALAILGQPRPRSGDLLLRSLREGAELDDEPSPARNVTAARAGEGRRRMSGLFA